MIFLERPKIPEANQPAFGILLPGEHEGRADGDQEPRGRTTPQIRAEIRRLRAQKAETVFSMARRFGLSETYCADIARSADDAMLWKWHK